MGLHVLVLADEAAHRDRLTAEVDALGDCDVVGTGAVDDGDLSALPADVVVWDLGANLSEGRAQLTRVAERTVPVLLLGPAGLGAEAMAAGAGGYVRRDATGARLRAALYGVAEGLQVLDPPRAAGPRREEGISEDLTAREMEVLQLLAEGLPNKEVARRLQISEHTVKFHVNTILAKLGAQTRTEAVTRAVRQGLIIL